MVFYARRISFYFSLYSDAANSFYIQMQPILYNFFLYFQMHRLWTPIVISNDAPQTQPVLLYGLPPSMADYSCVKFTVFLRLSLVPFAYRDTREHSMSPSATLPCVYTGKALLAGNAMTIYIAERHNINLSLSLENQALAHAFASLVDHELVFALDYELYHADSDYTKTRQGMFHWPLGFWIARRERIAKMEQMAARKPVINHRELMDSCAEAINHLSIQLDTNTFLFGDLYLSILTKAIAR